MPQKRRRSPVAKGTTSNPFKTVVRIPRQIENSATLWLDFFQQFCEITIDRDRDGTILIPVSNTTADELAVKRARMLADKALETFQERFPGVYPA